ncbi:MAG: hypothetical protein K0R69_2493 [Clostridia bacterium]|jgi:hypothetical protein|nr:hypothetical protein [Clostridia bacterium]
MRKRVTSYKTEFVEYIPKELKPGVLYISVMYNAVVHSCACGCGKEIVTPLDRHSGWVMTYDGENASLSPSIGNGRYECHSHYFLKNGFVEWLPNFGEYHIEKAQPKKSWLTGLISMMKNKR